MKKSRCSPVVIKEFGKMGFAEIYLRGHLYATIRHPNHDKTMRIAEEIKDDLERFILAKSHETRE